MNIIEKLLNILVPEKKEVEKILSLGVNNARLLIPASNLSKKDVFAIFNYQNKITKILIKSLKYKNNGNVRKFLAQIASEELVNIVSDITIFEGKKPILIPIPMSKKEKKERGFNQSEELLREIEKTKKVDAEFKYDYLIKTKETKKQAELKKDEREINLKFSMSATRGMSGAPVVIIDDIYTTGSTFNEAKRALKSAGAKNIYGLFLAH